MTNNDDSINKHIALTAKAMLRGKNNLNFLLIGRTGVGKSSTINSLLGSEVAPTGKYQPTTMEIETYTHNHNGFFYKITDTPGLCDDLPEIGNDHAYLKKIGEVLKDIDCVWFVTELDAARVTSDEKRGIKLITEALGVKLWAKAVIVFTRADKSSDFEMDLSERTKIIRCEIGKYYSHSEIIPSVAVSNTTSILPNGKPWLGELFTQVFLRFSDKGALPFLESMKKDIAGEEEKESIEKAEPTERIETDEPKQEKEKKKPRIELDEEQKAKIKESAWNRIMAGATSGSAIGGKIGKAFGTRGANIGTAIGAVCGGVLGFLFG